MQFISTSSFRAAVRTITKRPEHGYASCCKDICDELAGKTIDEIYSMNTRLTSNGDVNVIKLRIPNSELGLSKADGFRLIILCNKKTEEIVFLLVFPKRGKHGKLNIVPSETKALVKEYANERKANGLKTHSIKKGLEEVQL